MRGTNAWGYRPYIPACDQADRAKPYICRLAPGRDTLAFEWLHPQGKAVVRASYAPFASEDWAAVPVAGPTGCLTGLAPDSEYKLVLETAEGVRSRERRFRTGDVPGTVINYLHPLDEQYAFSGAYLCSPSLVKLPGGALLASMDLFGQSTPQNLTLVFRSEDGGATWRYVTDIFPCFWGKLFVHRGVLYMLGVSNEYGDLLIGCSQDEGYTWSTPTVILRGAACAREMGNHRAPMVILHSHGRLWTGSEYGAWPKKRFADTLLSIAEADDLMVAENWRLTEYVDLDARWPGIVPGIAGAIEGNAVETPEGDVVDFLRYAPGKALVLRADPQDPEAPLVFDRMQDFPLAHAKFEIQRHTDGWYYAVGNTLPMRTVLAVYRSRDLRRWEPYAEVVNRAEDDPQAVGFQYPSFCFDGDALLVMSRTAFNQAHNFHDSNYMTLHRVPLKA